MIKMCMMGPVVHIRSITGRRKRTPLFCALASGMSPSGGGLGTSLPLGTRRARRRICFDKPFLLVSPLDLSY